MKKVLRLTESDLIKFVKRIVKLSEAEKKRPAKRIVPKNNPTSNDDVDSNTYETFNNFYNEIRDYLRQYIDTDCVKFDATDRYLIVDVGAPYDFVDAGFEREEAVRVKNKLRSKGFRSIGVGRFIKEVMYDNKLSEAEKKRPAKRIVPDNNTKQYDYGKLIDTLKKTKLYNLLDNITKVRYLEGNIWAENSGGGLRLFIYDDDGSLKYNLSINGYNINRAIDLLLDLTKEKYLNDDILKELKSIQIKSSESISLLIRRIVSLIMERESIDDTMEEMVDRWFDNDYSNECRLIKQASEEVIEEMKKRYSNEIASYYNISFYRLNELEDVISKIFNNCKNS